MAVLRGLVCAGGIVGTCVAASAEPRLWPIEVGGKHGAIDRSGKVVIEPQYDASIEFSGGYARVSQNGKAGFVDTRGQLVISPKKAITRGSGDFAAEIPVTSLMGNEFSEGLAPFGLDGKQGYVDAGGDVVIAPAFDDVSPFQDGLAIVRKGSKFGWIDRSGAFVIPAVYDKALPFRDGVACVLVYDKGGYGYVDRKGQWAVEPQFNYAYPHADGRARAQVKGGYGYIDVHGKVVVPPPGDFKISSDFSDGRAPFHKSGVGWGYLDTSGKIVIEPKFFGGYAFSEGLARATLTGGLSAEGKRTEKRYGFIDPDGRFVIEPQFEEAGDFSEGLAGVFVKGKGYGYVDKKGTLRVAPQYAAVEMFHGGLARVWLQQPGRGPHAYLDTDGKEVWRSP